ncbi:CRISPR-associated endoribonuclease Cas6 [Methanocaldococcus bathoardescens]|nr:CRISPR-associated endoribonuclease Cas6 [Methanocaldococcus bathoardescens]
MVFLVRIRADYFTAIPYNHQYYLASAIYNKIHSANYLKTMIETEDGLKTYDLLPNNSKFYENLKNNLKKKYEAFYNEKCDMNFEFEILKYKPKRMRIKDIYCRCSEMVFKVWGDYELIKFGYECGFGEKNSMGFGMVMNIK